MPTIDATGADGASVNDETTNTETEVSTLSNDDVKNHELFLKVTKELAERRQADADRETAAAESHRKSEIEKAESEKRYDDALALQKEQSGQKDQEIQSLKLKFELSQAGFTDRGIALMSSEYKEGDISEYAKACIADEGNKAFMRATDVRQAANETQRTIKGGPAALSDEEYRAYEKSTDLKQRQIARDELKRRREAGQPYF